MGIMSRQHRLVAVTSLLVILQQQHLTVHAFQGQARTTIKSRTNVPPKTPINYYAARQSPLWSAAASSNHNHNNGNDNRNDNNQRPRKRDRIQNVLLQQKTTVLSVLQTFLAKLNIHVETARLQASMGSFLITAAILFGLLFGQPSVPAGNPVVSPITTVVANHKSVASTATTTTKATEIPYSQFMDHCCSRKLFGSKRNLPSRVQLEPGGSRAVSFWWHGSPHYTNLPEGTTTDHLVDFLHERGISFQAASSARSSSSTKSGDWSTTLVVGGIGYYMYQQGAFASLMTKGKQQQQKTILGSMDATKKTSFDDIEGVGNAKEAVLELVDSLRNPEKYRLVGARAPTGLLLEGPPGTGKTTLARAAASLADVPFLSASGSEFVEKYVGQGAARVRQLFDKAEKLSKKEKRPVIIFIDEIDALGKARGGGGGSAGGTDGSSQESEHTLIQLLASMDGLDSTSMICVLGATNRKDVLDKALVRPGRFDRIIKVDLPDAAGREGILRVHAQRLLGFWEGSGVDQCREGSFGKDNRVDLSAVAAATDGLSGAELEMIVNEAAIRAVRRVSKQLDEGIDKQAVDTTVYPHDFEASLEHFYQSRHEDKQRNKRQFGFDVELSSSAAQPTSRDLFYTAGTKRPAP